MTNKVALGVVSYGPQSPRWWKPMLDFVGLWDRDVAQYVDTYHSGVSTTDINRNNVVDQFEKGKADWLLWVDADNPPPLGAVERLLSVKKELVSGVYYGGDLAADMHPVAYIRNKVGAYHPIDQMVGMNKGDLYQVDSVGNGCYLNHRSVFEKIRENFSVYQRATGGLLAIRNDKVKGEVPKEWPKHPYSGEVRKGILYDPIVQVDMTNTRFPFYMLQFNRTEDHTFNEMARESGFEIWLDTSVQVGHVKDFPFSEKEYREQHGLDPNTDIREIEYV